MQLTDPGVGGRAEPVVRRTPRGQARPQSCPARSCGLQLWGAHTAASRVGLLSRFPGLLGDWLVRVLPAGCRVWRLSPAAGAWPQSSEGQCSVVPRQESPVRVEAGCGRARGSRAADWPPGRASKLDQGSI